MNSETHILVIDDDESHRLLLSYQIKKSGFTISQAGDVKTALQVLANEDIQLVLTDVHLPDGNGVELVKVIKAAYPLMEVIAITSQGRIADGVAAIKNGAFDYLEKGVDDHRLNNLLTAAAEKARFQTRLQALNQHIEERATTDSKADIITQNREQIEQASGIIKAIQSPLRQSIMHLLFAKGKANVSEIYHTLDLEQAIASQHLSILKEAGLVNAEREGKSVFYSANYTNTEKIIAFVQQLLGKQ